MLKPLEKFERKFGKIESKDQAQMIANTAKELLIERNKEFLRVLSKRVVVKDTPNQIFFKIISPNGIIIAEVICTKLSEHRLYVFSANVGKFGAKDDPLRNLGIRFLLAKVVINVARKKRFKRIELISSLKDLQLYQKLGFKQTPNSKFKNDLYLDL